MERTQKKKQQNSRRKIMAELKEDMLVPKVKVKEVTKEYEVIVNFIQSDLKW